MFSRFPFHHAEIRNIVGGGGGGGGGVCVCVRVRACVRKS